MGAPRTKSKIFTWLRREITKEFVRLAYMYFVYILRSSVDKSSYIGFTSNLKKRFSEHNSGLSLSTRNKRPYKLLLYEGFINKADAKSREVYLKSGWGFRSIKKLLKKTLLN